MVPHIRIPSHITALYVFAVVNLTLLVNITLVEANISVLNSLNSTIEEFEDLPAKFGNPFPVDGLWGRLVPLSTKDEEACRKIHGPPKTNMTGVKWIALIKRNHCDFDVKVLNAQKAGYSAAIIHNVNSDSLIDMGSGEKGHLVHIPSVFIGASDGLMLKNDYGNYTEFSIVIDRKKEFDANLYLLPFAIVVGICFILMLVFMVAKWLHDIRRKRRSRISKEHLKKIPVKKFKKGDDYEMCAICLDEYEDGDKLRILPCAHAYHMKCVDPWLTKSKRLCPLCKKKVIPGDVDDSSSDSDSEDESDRQSETAPLLAASSPSSGRRRGDSFERSGLPRAMRGNIQQSGDGLSDTSSDDGSITASFYQSSVEVHEQRHGSIQSYGATASLTLANETDDVPRVHNGYINLDAAEEDDVDGAADPPFLLANLDGLEGAVGGVDSVGLHIVEDHYHMDIPEPEEDLSFGDKEPLTASTESSGSNSSRDEHDVSVRNGTSRKKKKVPTATLR